MDRRAVVITGASTGIGRGAAKVLAEAGFHVFGSVRKAADGERLRGELGPHVTPLVFDVTDQEAVGAAAREVGAALGDATLAGLVNNAGIAVGGPLAHIPPADYRHQLEVNLIGPLIVTQAFLPLLGTDRARRGAPGRIVNISSVGGKMAFPFIGAYAASKHGLEAVSESLRRELMLYGIDVIIVGPGSVATPIWDKAEQADWSAYADTEYAPILAKLRDYMLEEGRGGLPAEAIGQVILESLTAARPKWRYAVLRQKFTNWTIPRLLPRRWVDRAIARRIGLTG